MKYNYKCVVAKNGSKMYYKKVSGKWKRITNKAGEKSERGKRKYRVSDQCSICLEKWSEKPSTLLGCGHRFHEDCINESKKFSNFCPLCRTQIYNPMPNISFPPAPPAFGKKKEY